MQGGRRITVKLKAKIKSTTQITEETFDLCPVISGWLVHKLGEFIDCIRNVKSGEEEVLEASHNRTKLCGIR
jgi:hypothetical protein